MSYFLSFLCEVFYSLLQWVAFIVALQYLDLGCPLVSLRSETEAKISEAK